MRAHEKARLLCVLQSTTCWVSQAQSTLGNDLKLHQKTTEIADNLTLQHLWFMLQKEDMLRCFALVALIIRSWMCINYIMIKAAILIDRIKIRSQHSQDGVIIIVWLSSRHTKGYRPHLISKRRSHHQAVPTTKPSPSPSRPHHQAVLTTKPSPSPSRPHQAVPTKPSPPSRPHQAVLTTKQCSPSSHTIKRP